MTNIVENTLWIILAGIILMLALVVYGLAITFDGVRFLIGSRI